MVDLSRYLPGPLVSRILADLGADVIKVEEPKLGDPVRYAPPMPGSTSATPGVGALGTLLLAGHRSVALDLKKPAARDCLEALLEDADVLVESLRPGTLARFGLAPSDLRTRHPRLVICSVTGWGQSGPHADRVGHDLAYQAVAGSLAPHPRAPAVPVADMIGGWSGATAVLAALRRRDTTGEGCWIDQALLDAAGHANMTNWAADVGVPRAVGDALPLTGALAGYAVYRTRDGGWVALAALEPHFWRRFCRAVERPAWVARHMSDDATFHDEVAALIATRDRDDWADLFTRHELPGEVVLSAAEARQHPQVQARDLVRDGEDGLPRLGYPACFDGVRPRVDAAAPALGADTHAVLTEHGQAEALGWRARWTKGVGRRPSLRRWLARLATGGGQGTA